MKKEVRKVVAHSLKAVLRILRVREDKDVTELKELSDKMTKYVSVYQDIDSTSLVILLYSLYKLYDRNLVTPLLHKKIFNFVSKMYTSLSKDLFKDYNESMKSLFDQIQTLDNDSAKYIQHIIEKASLTKGSTLFFRGISSKRAAEIMGISEWELLSYLGMTTSYDEQAGQSARRRLEHAEAMFS